MFICPILHSLHWLPVYHRIVYKILLLTFKALNNMAPSYLSDLLTPYAPAHALRSSKLNLLQPPLIHTCTYGERSFSFSALKLWNDLPLVIRQSPSISLFKTKLKTYLFSIAY